jgi:hypothetical protein
MIEIFLAAMAGLLSGLTVGGFVHRARYRAWNAERDLLKSQIEDDEGISDIDFNEIVETTLRNRAMGVEPIGLAALLVRRSESMPSGIDRTASEFCSRGAAEPTYGDLVPPLARGVPDQCDCSYCREFNERAIRNELEKKTMLHIVPRGK